MCVCVRVCVCVCERMLNVQRAVCCVADLSPRDGNLCCRNKTKFRTYYVGVVCVSVMCMSVRVRVRVYVCVRKVRALHVE